VAIDIKANLKQVRRRITIAAKRAERDPAEIKLVAVSKTHPPKTLNAALKAGVTALGENKVQEGEGKIDTVGRNAAEWHLVGHLQKNKARRAVQLFDVIHSVDSPELVHRLERICEEEGRNVLSVFVQVDLAGETTKSGIAPPYLQMVVEALKRSQRLRFDGLMVLPPFNDDPELTRPYFQRLREIRDRIAAEGSFANETGELSMGMTNDFEVAIEEGATLVRVGTAIFGERKRPR
jgi:pyridoxal phosphate enzyme (YggS family)